MSEQNLISATLTAANRDGALADLASFDAKLSFLLGLTPDERMELQKMGNIRRSFVEQTLGVAAQNAQVFPASFNLAEFQKDMALYLMLAPIMDAIQLRFEKVNDTMLALGSDLYAEALEAYTYIKAAGKSQGLDALREQTEGGPATRPEEESEAANILTAGLEVFTPRPPPARPRRPLCRWKRPPGEWNRPPRGPARPPREVETSASGGQRGHLGRWKLPPLEVAAATSAGGNAHPKWSPLPPGLMEARICQNR
jgi:hypothetical protein